MFRRAGTYLTDLQNVISALKISGSPFSEKPNLGFGAGAPEGPNFLDRRGQAD